MVFTPISFLAIFFIKLSPGCQWLLNFLSLSNNPVNKLVVLESFAKQLVKLFGR